MPAVDPPIDHRRLAPLGVPVVGTHAVHLHVGALRDDKLLVDVAALLAQLVVRGEELGAAVQDLAEELLGPSALRQGVTTW